MRSSVALALFTMLIGLVNCQTLNIGRCPTVEVKKDFDLIKVLVNANPNVLHRLILNSSCYSADMMHNKVRWNLVRKHEK
jgi:hypothetical protein